MCTSRRSGSAAGGRAPTVLWLLVLLAFSALPAGADEPVSPEKLLEEARQLEYEEGEHDPTAFDRAIVLYRQVLEDPTITDDQRGLALMGAGRCLNERGRHDEMADAFQAAMAVPGLSARDRAKAELELQRHKQRKADEGRDDAIDEGVEKQLREERARNRLKAEESIQQSWAALREGHPEEARSLYAKAMTTLGGAETPELKALWEAIDRASPDRAELLRNLMEFLETAKIQAYQELRSRVKELYDAGRAQFDQGSYRVAAEMFVNAIRLIDTSGFLGETSMGGTDDLLQDRNLLVEWLRATREKATPLGIETPPEPELPDDATRGSDFARQFYALLANAFGSLGSSANPLRFYEMKSTVGVSRPWIGGSPFEGGLSVGVADAGLTRARWAERWIRAKVPGKWGSTGRSVVARPGRGGRGTTPRTLVRFGDVLCVQHSNSVHREIQKLAASFPDVPRKLIADVHILSTDNAGLVTASQALAAYASPQESGRDLLLRTRIVAQCVDVLLGLEHRPVQYLGSSEIHFESDASATLEITALTADHPQYRAIKPPPLSVSVDDARYGLWLELYAEALTEADNQPKHNAVSVVARVRKPIGSSNVPRQVQDLPFTRIPLMADQHLELDNKVPEFGTLMLIGLKNPFPGGDSDHDQLIVLIGLRDESGETPDPPPNGGGTFVPPDTRLVDRMVGPLGTEVLDHLVQEDWPRQRAASEPLARTTLQDHRDRHLEDMIARGAGLIPAGVERTGDLPISVNRGRVSGLLEPGEVRQLDAYLGTLTRHAADLYDVDVVSVIAAKDRFEEWAATEGATRLREGWIRLGSAASESIDARMRDGDAERSLFALARNQNARSTQKIGFKKLALETVVRDQHVRRIGEDEARYTAIPSVVEEGFIVEVRPGLEQDGGYRTVYVRARAARIEAIRRAAYPGTKDVFIDGPVWFPVEGTSGAYPLTDGDALLVALPMPGVEDRVIALKVTVRKLR